MKEFTPAEFAAHLNGLADGMSLIDFEMLEMIGLAIETAAKDKIGEYQGEAGPFSSWESLAESTKEDRERDGYPADEPGLREGDMRDSIKHVVVPPVVVIGSDDQNLVYFEFGTVKQPPRSVLGAAAFQQTPWLVAKMGTGMEAYLAGVRKAVKS